MYHEKPLIIVLSRNYSTGLGIIRSLGAAGYTVDLVASVKKPGSSIIASCSKYVRNAVEVLSKQIQGNEGHELIDALMKYAGAESGKIMIFPTDDFTASIVDTHRETLRPFFLIPDVTLPELNITRLMDKTVQTNLAKRAGLCTPLEWIISLREDVLIPNDVVFPCFVKPLQSISGRKTEMAVCKNTEELYAHLQKMKSFFSQREVLIQEYLQVDCEYSMSGVCMDQDVLIPAVIQKTKIAGYERGVAVSGRLVPFEALGACGEKLIDLLKSFHYVGMFDVDLIQSDGKLYFSEVNLRSGGSNFAYFLNGVNLPDILIKYVTQQPYGDEAAKVSSYGKTFVYEKVAWEDYIHGYMTKSELKQCIANADYTLLNYSGDPAPGKCFEKRIRLSAVKQRLKKIIKR